MKDAAGPILALIAWSILLEPGPLGAAEPPGWKAGVARVDTTPTGPVRLSGYAARIAPSKGVAHPLAAKALALADATGHRAVLVTCDIIGFRRTSSDRVARRVEAEHGIPRADLAFFASHTHAGPQLVEPDDPAREGLEANVQYTRELEDKLVRVIGSALTGMRPASLDYAVGRAHFALNRREPTAQGIKLGKNPVGPTDEGVPILRVRDGEGKPLAVVFGYACHNTTLRSNMLDIDPDYAGYAQDRVELDNPGAVALFVTGCAGDADPHPFGTLDMAKAHGGELGEAVKLVLDHPTWLTPLDGPIGTAFTAATLHFAGPTDRGSYEKRLADPNPGRQRHARRMIEAIDRGQADRRGLPPLLGAGDRARRSADDGRPVRRGRGRLCDPPPEGTRRRSPAPLGGRLRQRHDRLHPLGARPERRRLRRGRVLLRERMADPLARGRRVDRHQGGPPGDRGGSEEMIGDDPRSSRVEDRLGILEEPTPVTTSRSPLSGPDSPPRDRSAGG